jgi:retron-type reverse transcriptase
VGVAEVTKALYAAELEANLQALSARLTRMGSRPQPQRRRSMPQPGRETERPLGLSSFADKIGERATKRGRASRFEPLCEAGSAGSRPQRSPPQGLDARGRTLQQKRGNILVEADLRGGFDAVNHAWVRKFLRQRLGDERVLRLISRRVKAGSMEDGLVQATAVGTPQGASLSLLLSHVYRQYGLAIWCQRRRRRHCRGEAYGYRFADEWVAGFQYQTEADDLLASLGQRMEEFHLELALEKTRQLAFGRYARAHAYRRGEKPKE